MSCMEFTFTNGTAKTNYDGTAEIIFTVDKSQRVAANEYYVTMQSNQKPMMAKISPKRNKRSLDANAYFWTLCGRLAEKTHETREDIYREMIKNNGVYTDILVDDEKAHNITSSWKDNGLGWFTEYISTSREHAGYSWHRFYVGSSQYDTKQMSLLIDAIVMDCKDADIETMTPDEIERLKAAWGKK